MHKPPITRISLAVLCALPLAAGAQQGLQLKTQPTLILVPPTVREEVPVFLEADRVQGHAEKEIEAIGTVRLRRRGHAVHADRLRYEQPLDEVTAEGRVRIERGPDVIEGTRLQYNLETERGFMDQPSYLLHKSRELDGQLQFFRETDARGNAERLMFEGPNQYRVQRGQYTSCGPGNDDWYMRARELYIDKSRDVGEARDASIVFMGVPIFYSPYLSFSLHQERKSGFITPHYGSTDKGGAEFTLPYYWNIAPNRDLTISPRLMTRRGMLVHNEFRYLEPNYLGNLRADVLPEDDARNGQQRWAYNLQHKHTLPSGWFGNLNLQKVSDDTYFTDLSTQIAATSQVLLPREGAVGRYGSWGGTGNYEVSALVQRWQTLQADPLALVTPPYNRQPQVTLYAARPDVVSGSDLDFYAHYVGYDHPTLINGRRALVYPSLSLPLQTPYAHVTPKLGVNVTRYMLDPNSAGFTEQTRTLPIFSTDAGVVFERPATFGGTSFVQTLEPRAYYLNIPFRDQSRIPVFDSAQQDINLTTIFSENQFAGWDRINDANQVTYGVSSRLLASQTGAQLLSGAVAQRYYFETQRVTLPGVPVRTSSSSDLLAAVSGQVAPHWTADAGWQYSTNFSQTQKFNIGTRYQPQPGRVINVSYRETLNVLRQTDVSTQWPFGRWTALARWNYSLVDQRTLEGLVGAEYNGDCWAVRLVAHRFAVATQQASTTLFLQLELNGVSRIGSNPMETLKRNIGGYVRLDPRAPLPDESRNPYY